MNTPKIPTIAELVSAPQNLLPADFDLAGWNSDHPIFDRLVDEVEPRTIIEVGSWKGRSAMHFAQATAGLKEPDDVSGIAIPRTADIYCVDTWLGGVDHVLSSKPVDDLRRDPLGSPRLYHQFLRNFVDYPAFAARIHPVQNTSINGARILAAVGVLAELIYIDGSHEYNDVYADLCAYDQLLAPGGVIFGDDFRSFPGVFAAVMRFAFETGRKIEEVDRNFWILRQP